MNNGSLASFYLVLSSFKPINQKILISTITLSKLSTLKIDITKTNIFNPELVRFMKPVSSCI